MDIEASQAVAMVRERLRAFSSAVPSTDAPSREQRNASLSKVDGAHLSFVGSLPVPVALFVNWSLYTRAW